MKKYITPVYESNRIESKDIITASFDLSEGVTPQGNNFVDVVMDINKYLNGLAKK